MLNSNAELTYIKLKSYHTNISCNPVLATSNLFTCVAQFNLARVLK